MRSWHDASNEKFTCPNTLKARLVESFPDDLSDDLNFQVGYYMGKNGAKRWIIEPRDLESMYSAFKKGTEIHLWCEGKQPEHNGSQEPPAPKRSKTSTRRELFEEEVDEIFKKLREKHEDFEGPKLRLWARLLHSGRYDDYDNPPNIPLITGSSSSSKKTKDTMKEALTGAATAVVKMLQSSSSERQVSERSPSTTSAYYASPLKTAQLRSSCLEDLKKIKELYEDGVLTEKEFMEQKESILNSLKNFN